jgi:hypothetical protein
VKGTETLLKPRAAHSRIALLRTAHGRPGDPAPSSQGPPKPKPPARRADSGPSSGLATSLDAGKSKGSVPRRRPSLAITSGSHQGQAIRIDSSAVDDCLRFSDQGLNQSRSLAVRFVGAACPIARHGMALNQWPFGSEEMSPAPLEPAPQGRSVGSRKLNTRLPSVHQPTTCHGEGVDPPQSCRTSRVTCGHDPDPGHEQAGRHLFEL